MEQFTSTAFLYEEIEKGICIWKCRSLDTVVIVPSFIDGKPVLELGAYTFSSHGCKPEVGIWTQAYLEIGDIPELSGERLMELHLPQHLRKVGAYAFYNCENLEKLHCYSTTLDWGAGAFTGCGKIGFLDLEVKEHEKSCLKELLTELPQTLRVRYRGEEEAHLLFPEFFEECVENTPARILETHVHGCGHQYRYCVRQSEIQFRAYDSLFLYVQVQEPEWLVLELAIERLRYPYGLTKEHEEIYMEYIRAHGKMAAVYAVRQQDKEQLLWLLEQNEYNKSELSCIIEEAGRVQDTAMLSLLMNEQHKRNSISPRKKFQL